MNKIILLALVPFAFSFCSEEKKLLRQASNAVERSDFDQALTHYDKIIRKNDKSFFGNAGKGIVLSEYMSRHEQAIPYLEKALQNSPPDKSKPIVQGNLGKSYHFIGNYKRALVYYGELNGNPDYADYDQFLAKRIADCKYALAHPEVAPPENQEVSNIGDPINTPEAEYTPVITNSRLYFTSKRQDEPNEKKNGFDGKYFEGVYVSKITDDGFGNPEHINFTMDKMKLRSAGEAVCSASPDGKALFIYKEGKLYVTDPEDANHLLSPLEKPLGIAKDQNHAALSPDGKSIYFTVDDEKGEKGSDIYFATRGNDGNWSEPQPLPATVNTGYDEEAPFVTEEGVLYFASNGHPGYGGFDIYRTQLVNGAWTPPVNLGQPVNSPGDDIFFSLLPKSSRGFYASARAGGKGDLDIYRVKYVINEVAPCKPEDMITIHTTQDKDNPLVYELSVQIPDQYKDHVKTCSWEVNGKALPSGKESFTHTFDKADSYNVAARVVAGCDTCPRLVGLCSQKIVDVVADEQRYATKEPRTRIDKNKATSRKKIKQGQALAQAESGTADKGPSDPGNTKSVVESSSPELTLGEAELKNINWNTAKAYFAYDDHSLSDETRSLLDENIGVLKNRSDLKVIIHGHADSRGSSAYNKQLSLKRAGSVKKYLVSNGISAKRIKALKGHGEDQLVNECTDGSDCDEERHAQNRRVQIDVIGRTTAITSR